MFNFKTLVRPNIARHKAYSCARDGRSHVLFQASANENLLGPALSSMSEGERSLKLQDYPDRNHLQLKQQLADFRNDEPNVHFEYGPELLPKNIYLGAGSDDAIDMIMRCVCVPATDKVLLCPPTRSTYSVRASVNDVAVVEVPLTVPEFQVDTQAVLKTVVSDPTIKVIFITSPGNPTATLVNVDSLVALVKAARESWNGLVVVDEAYVDFIEPVDDESPSMCTLVNQYENLVVLHSLSHSFGLAGIRLGITYCSEDLASAMNAIRNPYNISQFTVDLAMRSTSPEGIAVMRKHVREIVEGRDEVIETLRCTYGIRRIISGTDANFVLVEVENTDNRACSFTANYAMEDMAESEDFLVSFQGTKLNCTGALRISLASGDKNDFILEAIENGMFSATHNVPQAERKQYEREQRKKEQGQEVKEQGQEVKEQEQD